MQTPTRGVVTRKVRLWQETHQILTAPSPFPARSPIPCIFHHQPRGRGRGRGRDAAVQGKDQSQELLIGLSLRSNPSDFSLQLSDHLPAVRLDCPANVVFKISVMLTSGSVSNVILYRIPTPWQIPHTPVPFARIRDELLEG
jgi:hypothetical protein